MLHHHIAAQGAVTWLHLHRPVLEKIYKRKIISTDFVRYQKPGRNFKNILLKDTVSIEDIIELLIKHKNSSIRVLFEFLVFQYQSVMAGFELELKKMVSSIY